MIFAESPRFTADALRILGEDGYFALQDLLVENPAAGDIIPGSRGLRKIRCASGGKGRRGGSRVIYYWHVTPERIDFLRIYEKSRKSDLTPAEIKRILTELDS